MSVRALLWVLAWVSLFLHHNLDKIAPGQICKTVVGGVRGSPKQCMDIYGLPWISLMDIDGYPLIFIDIKRNPTISIAILGIPWISSENIRYPWRFPLISMDTHGYS